jgi:hypothetical protein
MAVSTVTAASWLTICRLHWSHEGPLAVGCRSFTSYFRSIPRRSHGRFTHQQKFVSGVSTRTTATLFHHRSFAYHCFCSNFTTRNTCFQFGSWPRHLFMVWIGAEPLHCDRRLFAIAYEPYEGIFFSPVSPQHSNACACT